MKFESIVRDGKSFLRVTYRADSPYDLGSFSEDDLTATWEKLFSKEGKSLLNINDCPANSYDLRSFSEDDLIEIWNQTTDDPIARVKIREAIKFLEEGLRKYAYEKDRRENGLDLDGIRRKLTSFKNSANKLKRLVATVREIDRVNVKLEVLGKHQFDWPSGWDDHLVKQMDQLMALIVQVNHMLDSERRTRSVTLPKIMFKDIVASFIFLSGREPTLIADQAEFDDEGNITPATSHYRGPFHDFRRAIYDHMGINVNDHTGDDWLKELKQSGCVSMAMARHSGSRNQDTVRVEDDFMTLANQYRVEHDCSMTTAILETAKNYPDIHREYLSLLSSKAYFA